MRDGISSTTPTTAIMLFSWWLMSYKRYVLLHTYNIKIDKWVIRYKISTGKTNVKTYRIRIWLRYTYPDTHPGVGSVFKCVATDLNPSSYVNMTKITGPYPYRILTHIWNQSRMCVRGGLTTYSLEWLEKKSLPAVIIFHLND